LNEPRFSGQVALHAWLFPLAPCTAFRQEHAPYLTEESLLEVSDRKFPGVLSEPPCGEPLWLGFDSVKSPPK
jgi:hypothetical protein